MESALHFGCRIAQASDGNLFVALGERYHRKDDAQKLDNHHGKVIRITPDGQRRPTTLRETARRIARDLELRPPQPQGATMGPDGKLWMHERMARRAATKSICPSRAQLRLARDHLR